MDIKIYIESGIIESYVLGLAEPEEILEIERLKEEYPEVQQGIDDFSIAIEEQAFRNAVTPPQAIKEQLLALLQFGQGSISGHDTPLVVAYNSSLNHDKPVVSIAPSTTNWKFLAAASIILFIVSAIANLLLYNRYTSTKSEYAALINERNTLQANNQVFQTRLKDYQSASEMMADPTIAMVQLKDPSHKNDNMTTVFWDSKSKDVYLLTNKLPAPNKNQQYQLWALVDGKPVDAGMILTSKKGDKYRIQKMKTFGKAEAFAVTLETGNGNQSPQGPMYVMGKM